MERVEIELVSNPLDNIGIRKVGLSHCYDVKSVSDYVLYISYKYKLNTLKYTLSLEFQRNPTLRLSHLVLTNRPIFRCFIATPVFFIYPEFLSWPRTTDITHP